MSEAKKRLIDALQALEQEIDFLSSPSLAPSSPKVLSLRRSSMVHDPARYMRRGLAIIVFNALEDYVKSRSIEIAAILNSEKRGTLGWRSQDQDGTIIDFEWRIVAATIDNLNARAIIKSQDRLYLDLFADGIRKNLSGTSVSPVAFRWKGSNLNDDALRQSLSILGCKKPWPEMEAVAQILGESDIASKTRELAAQRHRAAHDFEAEVPAIQLRALPRQALSIGASYDILSEVFARRLASVTANDSRDARALIASTLVVASVERSGKTYSSLSQGLQSRSLASLSNRLYSAAGPGPSVPFLVVARERRSGRLIDWYLVPASLKALP